MDIFIFVFEILLVLFFLLLFKLRRNFDFWKDRGIPYYPLPLIGNLETLTECLPLVNSKQYNAFPNEKFYGTFILWRPNLVVKDPEIIQQILIKDFPFLRNRNYHMHSDSNDLCDHLANRVDEGWSTLRSQLSRLFSKGKLGMMHSDMLKCSDNFVEYLSRFDETESVEIKDICGRYALDVIATCGFGLELDTINNPNHTLYEIAQQIFLPNLFIKWFFMLQPFLRTFYRTTTIFALPRRLSNYLMKAVDDLVEFRKVNDVRRPDILNHLSELKNRDDELIKNKKLKGDDPNVFGRSAFYSNCFMFLSSAYESSGTTLSNALYLLATNQDVQEKLHAEICSEIREIGGKIDFDTTNKMVYLDQVVSETLRMFPPGVTVDRRVSKDYKIPGTNIILPPGTMVSVPIYGLHRDPRYFPDPEKFYPERFDPTKNTLIKGTYMPFGRGPRTCIAERFAILEVKTGIISVLRKFKLHPTPKTKIPMEYEMKKFVLAPKDGNWLSLEKRVDEHI